MSEARETILPSMDEGPVHDYYLAGVDSGGTHTNIRIKAPDGTEKNVPQVNRSLTSNRSDRELTETISDIFTEIRSRTGGHRTFIWISAAGYAPSTRDRFEDLIRPSKTSEGVLGMANDAVTLLLSNEPEIVVVIAGTGSVSMARTSSGQVVTRGGDEWVVADYGSAFWIGLNGIRAAYRALEGGAPTALRDCLRDQFSGLAGGIGPLDDHAAVRMIARRLASEGTDTKRTIASFSAQVTQRAEQGDDVAREIVTAAADELAAAAVKVYRQVATSADHDVTPRFVLSGSVAHFSPFYAETFRASLDRFMFDVRESLKKAVMLHIQLSGMAQSLDLAGRLANGESIPELDTNHPYSVLR